MDEKLQKIIVAQCERKFSEDEVKRLFCTEVDLRETLGFDSILMVQLVVELESAFEIEFDLENLDIDILRYYSKLKNIINEKIGDKSSDN